MIPSHVDNESHLGTPDTGVAQDHGAVHQDPAVTVTTARTLCDVADRLTEQSSLRPGPEVDALFGRLVATVVGTPHHHASEVLSYAGVRDRMPRLRDLSARGEGELERFWTDRICDSADPAEELARFPYLDNYRRLVQMELGVLAAALHRPLTSVAIVGSGPLPLSAYFLAGPGVTVEGFDNDAQAVAASRRIIEATGVDGVRVHHVDGADADLSGHQVVVLAALVGSTPHEKARILARIRASMAPGAILLARSARGLRTLLYPPLATSALEGWELLNVIHPVNDIINSVVVARVPER